MEHVERHSRRNGCAALKTKRFFTLIAIPFMLALMIYNFFCCFSPFIATTKRRPQHGITRVSEWKREKAWAGTCWMNKHILAQPKDKFNSLFVQTMASNGRNKCNSFHSLTRLPYFHYRNLCPSTLCECVYSCFFLLSFRLSLTFNDGGTINELP